MNQIRIWLFVASSLIALQAFVSCGPTSKPPATAVDSVELCGQTIALSPQIQAQASKLGREPIEFSREVCRAVILAADMVRTNLPQLASGAAGTASTSIQPLGVAGSTQ